MAKCKACGLDFASTNPTDEICYVCERALKRLNGYAVPVVRCKDCIHYYTFACRTVNPSEDDWCCYGERRKADG